MNIGRSRIRGHYLSDEGTWVEIEPVCRDMRHYRSRLEDELRIVAWEYANVQLIDGPLGVEHILHRGTTLLNPPLGSEQTYDSLASMEGDPE